MIFVRRNKAALWHAVDRSYHWVGEVMYSTFCGRDIYLSENDRINKKRVSYGRTNACTQCARVRAKQLTRQTEGGA